MATGLLSGFIAIVVVAAVSWCAVMVYGIKVVRHARTGVKPWSRATLWNPANVILRPELLTEEGLLYRGRCLRALLVRDLHGDTPGLQCNRGDSEVSGSTANLTLERTAGSYSRAVTVQRYIGEAVWFIVMTAIAVSFFVWGYLRCCGPGIGLLHLIRRLRREPGLETAFAVAAVHAMFFAPALVIFGHTPLVVTVFVGAIVYHFSDQPGNTWWLAASGGLVFVCSLVYRYVRSNCWLPRPPEAGRR